MDRVLADGSMSLFVHFLNLKENKQTNKQSNYCPNNLFHMRFLGTFYSLLTLSHAKYCARQINSGTPNSYLHND